MSARLRGSRSAIARMRRRARNSRDVLSRPDATFFRWLRLADDHGAVSLGPIGAALRDLPREHVTVGDGVRLGDHVLVLLGPHGQLMLGDGVIIDRNVTIAVDTLVEIQQGATIGACTLITDTWTYGLDEQADAMGDRWHAQPPTPRPIVVEAGARVGVRSVLLPGARVRAGAVVPPATTIDEEGLSP